jgi:hypothetical protein
MQSTIYPGARLRWAIATLVLAAVVLIANPASGGRREGPAPGTVLHTLDPKLVLQVVVSGSDRKLFAYRQSLDDPFHIAFATRETRDAEHCFSGPGFVRFLEAVTSLPVFSELRNEVDPVSENWVVIELWDGSGSAGDETRLRRPNSASERTILQYGYDQYVVDFDGALWDSIRSGCAGLGAPS